MADRQRKGDQEINLVDFETQVPVKVTAAGELKTTAASALPPQLDLFIAEFLKNGGSDDMLVDGSSTPVEFSLNADPTDDVYLNEVKVLFTLASVRFDGSTFGKNTATLTNGMLLTIRSQSVTTEIANFKTNEDFVIQSNVTTQVTRDTTGDFITAVFNLGNTVRLVGGSSDFVKITIRDDVTAIEHDYLKARVTGFKDL